MRAAEDALRAKTTLFATLTHELRTPLNGILGMAGLLELGKLEPNAKTYVSAIKQSGELLLDLITEMKRLGVKLILVEPYFDLKTPDAIARETGAKVLVFPPSVGGVKEVTSYIQLFDYDINLLISAIKEVGAKPN